MSKSQSINYVVYLPDLAEREAFQLELYQQGWRWASGGNHDPLPNSREFLYLGRSNRLIMHRRETDPEVIREVNSGSWNLVSREDFLALIKEK